MGIVTQIIDPPTACERNQEYLGRRRVQQPQNQYDDEELFAFLEDAARRDESLAEKLGVESPDAVAIAAHTTDADHSVEAIWWKVLTWKTMCRRISLLEQVLQTDADGTAGQRIVT